MKLVIYAILSLCFCINSYAQQNMVPNGNFEDYTLCPSFLGQTALCNGWGSFTSASPDYYNACASFPAQPAIPRSYAGYQYPASGNGYMGLIHFTNAMNTYKELICRSITPLRIGIPYQVSMSINLAELSGFATDNMGVFFYKNLNGVTTTTTGIPVGAVPQVRFQSFGVITDTQNWVRVTTIFRPDSAYDNIAIGSFDSAKYIAYLPVSGGTSLHSYYFIDSIVIKQYANFELTLSDSSFCAGDTFMAPYAIYNTNFVKSANIFTVQLSDATGSFNSPITIGTLASASNGSINCIIPPALPSSYLYKMRLISSDTADTSVTVPVIIGNSKPLNVVMASNSPICSGTSLNLTANSTTIGVTYKWAGPNGFVSSLRNPSIPYSTSTQAGKYVVSVFNNGCRVKDSTNVTVIPSAYPLSAGVDISVCEKENQAINITNAVAGAAYLWIGPNGFSSSNANPTIGNIPLSGTGDYIITGTLNGCITKDTVAITVKPLPANLATSSNTPVCSGQTLNLTTSSTTSNVSWSWEGPFSFSSSVQNPARPFMNISYGGRYIATATLNGCSIKDTVNVMVTQGPTTVIATVNTPVCNNDTIKLMAASTAASFSWTGPNGFTSNLQNPAIPHAGASQAGDYIVSASLNGCTVKDTVSVAILIAGFAVTATSNSPVCDNNTFSMNASSTIPATSFSWTGPNGFTASGSTTSLSSIHPVNAGDYIVTGTNAGCSAKDTVTLTVTPLPGKPVISGNSILCTTDTLRLLANSATSGVSYSWAGPNSFTSSLQNPSINNPALTAAGDYIVTVSINGCSAKDTETVTITQSPAVLATNNSPVCNGANVSLLATSDPGVAYSWTGPNGYISFLQNPVITNAGNTNIGDYIVSATINGCKGKDTTTLSIKPNPVTPAVASNTPVCIGNALNLTASSTPGSTYSWTGPNSFTSSLQNPSISNVTANHAGTYNVTAVLNGCSSTAATTTVVINPRPFINIFPTPSDSICSGASVTFTAVAANTGTGVTYKWTKNSNTSILSTANSYTTSTLSNNDIIRCEMTDPSKCGSAFSDTSNEIKMTVLPWLAPSVSIISNPTTPLAPYQLVTFTATPVNGGNNPKYQWQRNSSDVIGATSNVWGTQQLSDNDNIRVILTSSYKCPQPAKDTSNTIRVAVLTGVNNVDGASSIQLYPNPNNGSFTIKGNIYTNKEVDIKITNAVGQLVYSNNALPQNQELNQQVNLPELANGTYQLTITTENNKYSHTFKIMR